MIGDIITVQWNCPRGGGTPLKKHFNVLGFFYKLAPGSKILSRIQKFWSRHFNLTTLTTINHNVKISQFSNCGSCVRFQMSRPKFLNPQQNFTSRCQFLEKAKNIKAFFERCPTPPRAISPHGDNITLSGVGRLASWLAHHTYEILKVLKSSDS